MDKSVDCTIGRNVKHRRWMLGLPRQDLAKKIGVSKQQLHNYETGISRISASRLWSIARHLQTPVVFFFNDLKVSPSSIDQVLIREPKEWELLKLLVDFCRVPETAQQERQVLARAMNEPACRPN